MRQHRLVGKRPRLFGIDLENPLQELVGLGVPLAVDQLIGLQQQAVDVPRVDLERLGERLGGSGAILGRQGAGQQVMKVRLERGGLRRLSKRLGRQGIIFLLECHLGRGEIGFEEVRLLLGDDVVKLVEHLAGVGSAHQEEPSDGDKPVRVAKRR